MEPVDALLMLVAVGLVAALVLRDIAAYERPRTERVPRAAKRAAKPAKRAAGRAAEPVATPTRAHGHEVETVRMPVLPSLAAAGVPETYDPSGHSLLGALASVEHDERSAGRRVLSALTLLTLTLLTAAGIGAAIYRGLQSVSGK